MDVTRPSGYPVETRKEVPHLSPDVCIRDLTLDTIQLADGRRLADLRVVAARGADLHPNPLAVADGPELMIRAVRERRI
jgi:hypothetical protein